LERGELDPAHDAFDRALAFNPQNADAYNGKGLIAIRQSNFAQAIDFFDNAVEFAPENAGFHLNRAIALLKMNRTADARAAYQKAIALEASYKGTLEALEKY